MARGNFLAHDGRRKKGRHQRLQSNDQRRNARRHAMRHRPIDRTQIAAMQQGSGNGRMKGVGPVGPGRPLIERNGHKQGARNGKADAEKGERLHMASRKPGHHKSRGPQHHKEGGCKGNPVGRRLHGLSHAKLCPPARVLS